MKAMYLDQFVWLLFMKDHHASSSKIVYLRCRKEHQMSLIVNRLLSALGFYFMQASLGSPALQDSQDPKAQRAQKAPRDLRDGRGRMVQKAHRVLEVSGFMSCVGLYKNVTHICQEVLKMEA